MPSADVLAANELVVCPNCCHVILCWIPSGSHLPKKHDRSQYNGRYPNSSHGGSLVHDAGTRQKGRALRSQHLRDQTVLLLQQQAVLLCLPAALDAWNAHAAFSLQNSGAGLFATYQHIARPALGRRGPSPTQTRLVIPLPAGPALLVPSSPSGVSMDLWCMDNATGKRLAPGQAVIMRYL